jgi:hypothetical protein
MDALRQVQSTSSVLIGLEAVGQGFSLLRFNCSSHSFLMRFLVLRCVFSREMAVPRVFAEQQNRERRFVGSAGECVFQRVVYQQTCTEAMSDLLVKGIGKPNQYKSYEGLQNDIRRLCYASLVGWLWPSMDSAWRRMLQ